MIILDIIFEFITNLVIDRKKTAKCSICKKEVDAKDSCFVATGMCFDCDDLGAPELDEDDSIYYSSTFGHADTCKKCGAPMIGITERVCANPNC